MLWVFFVVEERNISCFLRIIAVTAVSIWSQIAFFKVLVLGVKGDQERNTWKDECVCGCYEEKKARPVNIQWKFKLVFDLRVLEPSWELSPGLPCG